MSSGYQSQMSLATSSINNENQHYHNSFEHELSRYYFPFIPIIPSLHRATHSDVLCISNNGISKDHDEHKSLSTSCQLPYEEIYATNQSRDRKNKKKIQLARKSSSKCKSMSGSRSMKGQSKGTLLSLHERHELDSRKRMDKRLHDEHRIYMSTLKKQHEERFQIETNAVVIIQKMIRGFQVRLKLFPELYSDEWMNKKGVIYSEDEIWMTLLEATSKIGIGPKEEYFLGFEMPAYPKKN